MKLNDLQQPVAPASMLAPQAITVDVLKEKYCRAGETSVQEVCRRVAGALAKDEAPAPGCLGANSLTMMAGRKRPQCGVMAVIQRADCDVCSAPDCGDVGRCG